MEVIKEGGVLLQLDIFHNLHYHNMNRELGQPYNFIGQ